MSDNKIIKDYRDRTKINTSESYEIAYWTNKWGITEEQLKTAVAQAGNGVKKVEAYLVAKKWI